MSTILGKIRLFTKIRFRTCELAKLRSVQYCFTHCEWWRFTHLQFAWRLLDGRGREYTLTLCIYIPKKLRNFASSQITLLITWVWYKKYNNRLCFKMLTHGFYFLLSIRPPLGTYYWDISLSAGSLPMVGHTAVKHSQPSLRILLLIFISVR